jgi:hypothetical protein
MGGWRSMSLDDIDLKYPIYYLRSYQYIYYLNQRLRLWVRVSLHGLKYKQKEEKNINRAGDSALSSNTPSGFWLENSALASPHPLLVSSPCHPAVSSVVRSVELEASSLGSALRCWALASGVGFYPPALGSTLRR